MSVQPTSEKRTNLQLSGSWVAAVLKVAAKARPTPASVLAIRFIGFPRFDNGPQSPREWRLFIRHRTIKAACAQVPVDCLINQNQLCPERGKGRMPRIGMEPLRRKALISAAIEAIHDRGMGQVTMGEIARRAGVSPALAHHYFGGKDQLLLATMRHLLAELGEEIQSRLAAAQSPRERISAVIRGNFAAAQFRPAVISAWLAF